MWIFKVVDMNVYIVSLFTSQDTCSISVSYFAHRIASSHTPNNQPTSNPAQVLWGECLAGALYDKDFERMARKAGFTDPRILSVAPIEVEDYDLQRVVGQAKFYSITYR